MEKLHYDHIILEYASQLQSTANAKCCEFIFEPNRMNFNEYLFYIIIYVKINKILKFLDKN